MARPTTDAARGATTTTKSWAKWVRVAAAIGLTSLALGSDTPRVHAADPAAHFRGGPASFLARSYAHSYAQEASAAQAQYQQQQAHRRLDANASMDAAVDKANQVGASVRKAIKQLRGGTDKFYHDLITAVKIQLCDQLVKGTEPNNPKNRFVDKSDTLAYVDSNNDCVKVQLTAMTDQSIKDEYTQGHCEVKPNCYWSTIEAEDTERRPVYSVTEAAQPVDGAMTLEESKDVVIKWAQGLMIFVVPGIILSVLSLLTMVFFLLCRCCCNRCGGRSPREGGYTCLQKFYPVLFFVLFSVGIIVVAGVSMLYQKTLTTAVSDVFQSGSDTLDDAVVWVHNIEAPLTNIRDKVIDSAADIKVQLDGTDFIEVGLDGLTGKLTTFGDYSADRTLPEGCTLDANEPYCLPCVVCTTIHTEVDNAATQISANAGDGIALLKSVRESLNTLLVSAADTVKDTVNQVVDTLDILVTTIVDAKSQVTDIQDQYEGQKQAQKFGVLAPFVLAIIVVVLGFVGVLFGLTPLKFLANIIHIAYIFGFIALFLTFILASLFLAISVVLGDVCEITAIFTQDWTVPLGEAAKGINACFQNASLIDTFNMSSSLEFARGGIAFPEGMDMTKMLDFSDLDTFANAIKATDASTFALPAATMTSLLATLNALVKQTAGACAPFDAYTLSNVYDPWTATSSPKLTPTQTPEEFIKARYALMNGDCDQTNSVTNPANYQCSKGQNPCDFSDAVLEIYHSVKMLALVDRDSAQFITDLHTNITVVTDYTDDFKDKTKTLDGKIMTIKTDLEGSLIKYVGDFENAMYCTFISDGFFEIYDVLCGDLMPALTMISLMIFLAGVFLFPVNVCLIIALKRLKARGSGGHVMDNEMKFK